MLLSSKYYFYLLYISEKKSINAGIATFLYKHLFTFLSLNHFPVFYVQFSQNPDTHSIRYYCLRILLDLYQIQYRSIYMLNVS